MSPTLWRSSLRYLLRNPWQVGLSALGIALGVAVVVSIDLANESAKRAFTLSTDAVAGRATHEIVGGPAGLAEEIYRSLRVDHGVRSIAPVVEGFAEAPAYPGGTIRVLGVDPVAEAPFRSYAAGSADLDIRALISQPGTGLLASETAERMGLDIQSRFELSVNGIPHSVRLVGLIEPDDEVARQGLVDLLITDISTAQELLGTEGRLSRIDVVIVADPTGEALERRIQAALPPGAELARTSARSEAVDQMTRAFDLNLTALSLLALIVGMFLIYNAVTFSVVRRRRLIGTLRALGVTRRQIFALLLGEALVVGTASSALGLALGVILGRGLVGLVTRTINDLYFVVTVRELSVDPLLLAKGALLGVAATLVAAVAPALEATTVPTQAALSRSSVETRLRHNVPLVTLVGVAALAVGATLLLYPSRELLPSFAGLFALVMGFALLVPAATIALMAVASRVAGRSFGLVGSMAARGVSSSLSRTAVAVAALAVAVSITVGIGTMVESFRGTVVRWLDASLGADLYVSPPSELSNRLDASLDPELATRIRSLPGVEDVTVYRGVEVMSEGGPVNLVAVDSMPRRFRAIQLKEGDASAAQDALQTGDAVLVSEPYAYHHDLGVGSNVRLRTNGGLRDFEVAGVYYDYSSGQGVVMVSRDTYLSLWDDPKVSSLGVYASPDVDLDELSAALRHAAGDERRLRVRSNRELREASLEVFDRSFAVTTVLRTLAMIVAFVGVLSSLMALQLERARELGVLRAIGFTPRQVWVLVTSQTGLMGLVAGLLALPMGIVLALGLVFVVNRRSFGWSMQVDIVPAILLEAVVLSVVAAVLAGVYPAFKMASSPPAEALREE